MLGINLSYYDKEAYDIKRHGTSPFYTSLTKQIVSIIIFINSSIDTFKMSMKSKHQNKLNLKPDLLEMLFLTCLLVWQNVMICTR